MDLFLFLLARLTYRAHAGCILRSAADEGFIDGSLISLHVVQCTCVRLVTSMA